MSKEKMIEICRKLLKLTEESLREGDLESAQRHDRMRAELMHKIDDLGGLK